jgi:hypothetical protein
MACVPITTGLKRGFFERRGREGFAEGAKGIPKGFGFDGHFFDDFCNGERSEVALYARLGIYRPPSYWSTRNRSFDKHLTVQRVPRRATGIHVTDFAETTGSALPCVQAIERMRIDRFLVLQYEGDSHTLYRPKRHQHSDKQYANQPSTKT